MAIILNNGVIYNFLCVKYLDINSQRPKIEDQRLKI